MDGSPAQGPEMDGVSPDGHGGTPAERVREVFRQLDRVYDPELDEPLTQLGFIGGVEVDGGTVVVHLRLPTFWCAANFAYMMASDICDRVGVLPWVERVEVRLADHFFADEINQGVNRGLPFHQAFPDLATAGLEELAEAFRIKAFLRRQERLVRWLLDRGWNQEAILRLRVGDLVQLQDELAGPGPAGPGRQDRAVPEAAGGAGDPATTGASNRGMGDGAVVGAYLEALRERGFGDELGAPALVDPLGEPLTRERFPSHLHDAARTRLAMEFNAAFCAGLLRTRYGLGERDIAPPSPAGTPDRGVPHRGTSSCG
ncbi:iron-sulfur cluster assembly protein [Thermaerobacter marianensis]|nr:iron-sulfur cluster assembly protein [Thermaerobacter marianensis]